MTNRDWDRWVEHHSTVFGMQDRRELAMLNSWRDFFESDGYSTEELFAATEALTRDPPRFRSDHLGSIRRGVERHRHETRLRRAAERRESAEGDTCPECSGTGFVIVPHRLDVSQGAWVAPYRTFAVQCGCGAIEHGGIDSGASGGPRKRLPLLTLSKYERTILPDWQDAMAQRDRRLAEESTRSQGAGPLDAVFGALQARLKTQRKRQD